MYEMYCFDCGLFCHIADVDACGKTDMVQVQALYRHQVELLGHSHRFGFLYYGNDEVFGHTLPIMAEERMPASGEVRLFH